MNATGQKIWLITGAAGALGSEMVRQILVVGQDCIALDRDEDGLERLHDELDVAGLPVPALMPFDLAGAGIDDYQQLAAAIDERFGRLDHLVHNAATFQSLRPLLHQPPGEWLEIIQTSLTGSFMLTAALAPLMSESGRSVVAFISDRHALDQAAGWGAFGVAQAARHQMARILEAESTHSAPAVVEIDPGPFYSRLRVAAWPSDSPQDLPAVADAAERVLACVDDAATDDKQEEG
jgi:NAD(P)-dependent dehydrogenase (short-subunit alcohol dehydrogenase family)